MLTVEYQTCSQTLLIFTGEGMWRKEFEMKEGKLSVSAFTDLNLRSTLSGPSEARESG